MKKGLNIIRRNFSSFYKPPLNLKSSEGQSFRVHIAIFRKMTLQSQKPIHLNPFSRLLKKILCLGTSQQITCWKLTGMSNMAGENLELSLLQIYKFIHSVLRFITPSNALKVWKLSKEKMDILECSDQNVICTDLRLQPKLYVFLILMVVSYCNASKSWLELIKDGYQIKEALDFTLDLFTLRLNLLWEWSNLDHQNFWQFWIQ